MTKQLSIELLNQLLYKRYIKNVTINFYAKKLKISEENKYKYNSKYYSKINTKNNIFENIVDKFELNNKYNSIKSLLFSNIFIEIINSIFLL